MPPSITPPSPPPPQPLHSTHASSLPPAPSSAPIDSPLGAHTSSIFSAYESGQGAGLKGLKGAKFSTEKVEDWKNAIEGHQTDDTLPRLTRTLEAFIGEAKSLSCRKLCLFTEEGAVVLKLHGDGAKIYYAPAKDRLRAKMATHSVVSEDLTKTILSCLYQDNVISKFLGPTPGAGQKRTEGDDDGADGGSIGGVSQGDDADWSSTGSGSGHRFVPNAPNTPNTPSTPGIPDTPDTTSKPGLPVIPGQPDDPIPDGINRPDPHSNEVSYSSNKDFLLLCLDLPSESVNRPMSLNLARLDLLMQQRPAAANDPVMYEGRHQETVSPPASSSPTFKMPPFLSSEDQFGPTLEELVEKFQNNVMHKLAGPGSNLEAVLDKERRELDAIEAEISKSNEYSFACRSEMLRLVEAQSGTRNRMKDVLVSDDSAEGRHILLMTVIGEMCEKKIITLTDIKDRLVAIAKQHHEQAMVRKRMERDQNGLPIISTGIAYYESLSPTSPTKSKPLP